MKFDLSMFTKQIEASIEHWKNYDVVYVVYEHYFDYLHSQLHDLLNERLANRFVIGTIDRDLSRYKNKTKDKVLEIQLNRLKLPHHFSGYYFDISDTLLNDLRLVANQRELKKGLLNGRFGKKVFYSALLANFADWKVIHYNNAIPQSFIDHCKLSSTPHEQLLSRLLMYRYQFIEKIRDANIIGIVIGTLVVGVFFSFDKNREISFMFALEHFQITKRSIFGNCQVFETVNLNVGKMNECKLGNFSEVELFVVITCPLSFQYLWLWQQQNYSQGLVTPFECELALNIDHASWTGLFSTDFNDILNKDCFRLGSTSHEQKSNEAEHNEMRFSAIDGKLRPTISSLKKQALQLNERDLIPFHKPGDVVKMDAAWHMSQKRTFKGAEVADDNLPPSNVEQGLTGIASRYTDEI
ncbi:diphthamide biosynthesis protein 2 [Reticulomyxa filosa]|uniref:Diphthamide biosynthesis protein 2 n=1 Tax=Reticulomyxa filosa TaxID=46433 RepID=X6MJ63_RETFI|nr:diphthamide biosynthesis protein 2 [Reticulomyxa filosa]|eukprot:ETO13869.1 diphthamide biosynthesis protein 2 [Reticulomyxa filosa]